MLGKTKLLRSKINSEVFESKLNRSLKVSYQRIITQRQTIKNVLQIIITQRHTIKICLNLPYQTIITLL